MRLRCGRAWLATGYGFDPGTRGDVRLESVIPSAHGWDFSLENTGSAPGAARVSARCLRQTVSAAPGGELRVNVARRVFADILGPKPGSAGSFTHSCAKSQFSLATGYSVDPVDAVELGTTHPTGKRAGRWTFRRAAEDDVVTTFLLCLSRRTVFR